MKAPPGMGIGMRRRSASSDGNQTTAISVLKTCESSKKLIGRSVAEILALVQSLLEEEGHKIFTARNVDEALAILAGPEPLDALLVDIILNQDMQAGIELAKRAVALKPGLKVVYSTGLTLNRPRQGIARAWGGSS
jgi:CheY-like chemotaxis protein